MERFHSFFFCLRRRIILFVSDGILFANSWKMTNKKSFAFPVFFPYWLFTGFGNGLFYDSGIIIAATSAVAEGVCFIIPLCLLGIDRNKIVRLLECYHIQHLLISV